MTYGGVRLDRVSQRYRWRGDWVLREIDLDFVPGTLTRLDGGNGSGKSTLLRLVSGVAAPTRGRVRGRRRNAYVPARFPAGLPFDAAVYLRHLARLHGLPARRAEQVVLEWLERLGLAAVVGVPIRNLSKGNCQRVALAQALISDADLLALDEAWTGLDEPSREVLDEALVERARAGNTVIFVDHDPSRLAGRTDRTLLLEAGRVSERPTVPPAPPGVDAEGWRAMVVIEVVRPQGAGFVEQLRVPAFRADDTLRALLAPGSATHVLSVNRVVAVNKVVPVNEVAAVNQAPEEDR